MVKLDQLIEIVMGNILHDMEDWVLNPGYYKSSNAIYLSHISILSKLLKGQGLVFILQNIARDKLVMFFINCVISDQIAFGYYLRF